MPLIAITGPVCAGRHTIADWLVSEKDFRRVRLRNSTVQQSTGSTRKRSPNGRGSLQTFDNIDALIEYATRNWREDLVVTDISRVEEYDALSKRPFFLLISVDAPLMARWNRYKERCTVLDEPVPSFVEFVEMSDAHFYGCASKTGIESLSLQPEANTEFGHAVIFSKSSLRIMNTQQSLKDFHAHLADLDIVNPDRIRPSWDAYFMQLASLASLRSNCMKRRVGCVLVRNNRVISTGYNGTPRGLLNCNQGGCARCNSASAGGVALGACLCLHAEENALLESGRERVGAEARLYCNTCPCLTCSVKIAQVGVKEVIYNQAYSMDDQSAAILKEAGVLLRQFSPPYED